MRSKSTNMQIYAVFSFNILFIVLSLLSNKCNSPKIMQMNSEP